MWRKFNRFLLKLFKNPVYPKVLIDNKTKKIWIEDNDFLGYKIGNLKKLVNYTHKNADSQISVWGNNCSGTIIARIGDVFDDIFVEETFNYFNQAQFKFMLDAIMLYFHQFINKQISIDDLNFITKDIKHI